ncbi:MAG TPA: 2Fe-2S iron-sulfur cluster-binding protein [Polyangia bacterium]|nr:2Fe-2S iron-sulfur cluster-binding protein [Polyangia bacterium]
MADSSMTAPLTMLSGPPVPAPAEPAPVVPAGTEMVTVTIDGVARQFPKGTNLLEACNQAGAEVPFFCYHKGLSSPAVCRQCLVDVKGQPKPVPSCYTPVADKMEVTTASPRVLDIRRQMLEFTLLNHPIDCPICDKAGECTLQKHYFDWDAKYARNDGIKVHKAKVVDLGKHIVLDQERCILCTRCIRVCNEVAKEPELTMAMRGDHEVLTTAPGKRLDNPYSLNTVDVCPVGALTSKDFRFSMRAWELQSTPSVCPGCATGCNVDVHSSRGEIHRLVPRENLDVNQHWMCDEGRFTYKRVQANRLGIPLQDGSPVEWDKALEEAARALRAGLDQSPARVGVVFSAQSTNEDLYTLSRLAFGTLGVSAAYVAGLDQGWHDNILVSADKNPNTAGAIAIGAGRLKSLMDLANDLKNGKLSVLLIVGDAGVLGPGGTASLPLAKLDALVVLASHRGPLAESARVALPMAAWAEVDGTFTNRQGTVQRIRAAVPAVGDALPAWEILSLLAHRLGMPMEFETGDGRKVPASARAVFLEAKQKMAFMKNADWGRTSLPIQLRFANSRG